MPTSRRSVLAAASCLASVNTGATPRSRSSAKPNEIISELIERSEASNSALMRGDIERYRALLSFSDDFTLMSPFGGAPTHARALTPDRIEAMGRFFRNGSLRQDVVQAYGTSDMVVLAVIERSNVEVGGLPAQDWSLRVTLVYRREGDDWPLVHRHADPLVAGISLEHSAALARGER